MPSSPLRHIVVLAAATGLPCAALAQATGTLSGSVVDSKGALVPHANVQVHSANSNSLRHLKADDAGHFSVDGLAPGVYVVDADAAGFSVTHQEGIRVSADKPAEVSLKLAVADANTQITVEADTTGSVAASLAPMDAPLTEMSARTEITQSFIENFTSPVSDYGEIVQMVPGTFTTSSNGVGLGQSKTQFRGFPDGDYDIDFDGIPFYDTNSPTHHSWAFFPAQFVGGVDFDRSPGTASTIGPTPFGGSIHLLSKNLSPLDNLRVTASGGAYNTYLYDASYDTGTFGPGKKLEANIDVHHMQSQGYQTLNKQSRNGGDIKLEYKLSDKTTLTGYSSVIWLDSNNPNFNATRCQMYGAQAGYTCFVSGSTTQLLPYTGAGINFLNVNNSDPEMYLDYQYNFYHVPTDFEYVGLHTELGKGFTLDFKPYTYNYDNSEKYSNAVAITDDPTQIGQVYAPLGTKVTALCTTPVTKKGVTAIPCGVDKYNSYRKYGETSEVSQVSKYGIFRAGLWYEWANTNRHQYPSDPLNHWHDQALPNFAEKFVTDSYQPFVEYQFHVGQKLNITPGVKWAYYTIGTQQFADDGKTIGGLGSNNPSAFIANGGSYFSTLPSLAVNYRLLNNWSVYVQAAQGSIVPPSNVFDYNQGTTGTVVPPAVLPKQQKNTTYQGGTVLKLKYATLDADYFHIHFDNSYSSQLNPAGEPVFYVQPSSVTQGFEAESNISLTHGLGVYLNASYTKATYSGQLAASCVQGSTGCSSSTPQVNVSVPSDQWVSQTPSNIESEGVTYQHRGWDAALFNHRVGKQYLDNGQYHNQFTLDPFNVVNAFVNYTIRTGGHFDQTKIRLSFNNLTDSHSVTNISLANGPAAQTFTSNGVSYTDPFNTVGTTAINGQDAVSIVPGRSVMLSVTFGFTPHLR